MSNIIRISFAPAKVASVLLTSGSVLALAGATQAAPLSFDNPTVAPTGTSPLGPTITESTAGFTDVASQNGITVDALVTTTVKAETDFADVGTNGPTNSSGYVPDYSAAGTDEPNDDLGIRYFGNNVNDTENGLTTTISFYDGSGDRAGSFSDAVTLDEASFGVYDVDGSGFAEDDQTSAQQTEFFRAFLDDGLASYQLGNSEQSLTASLMDDSVLFEGPGTNFAEDDPTGAAILNYVNTDSISLDFGSVLFESSNGRDVVFSAIDGDTSLFDEGDFTPPTMTPIPVPAALPLLLGGLGGLGIAARRRRNA